ncbi:membrane protein [Microbacterium sorbitolivorans]|uniref:RDD family protein n=1 Tax=Microbacterium sorbitolivorans TaxID=1867410 RepID=A0A367XWL0_9MICO|nr:RDD family protein [Microbacterium sorbitolivorans]RCK57191.1 RDD family protein [Microbacterium sorbitolivorans]GGF45899.1 membrane protein [Microbacterium sorbitolivorans]
MTISGPRALVAEDEILTGEAVALDRQPLGLGLRLLGGLIDAVLGWIVYLALAVFGAGSLVDAGVLDAGTYQIFAIIALVVCFAVVPITVETLTGGRSLGKLAAGGRIVRSDGGAIGFRHAFIRGLLGVLEVYMTFGGLALIVGMFTPRAQRLGDLMAGTYSERARRTRLPVPSPGVPDPLAGWARVADVARLPARLDAQVTRFASGSGGLSPAVRARIAAELAGDVAPYVTPIPDVAPELLLQGVAAVRREREGRMLRAERERAEIFAGQDPFTGAPQPRRGGPES